MNVLIAFAAFLETPLGKAIVAQIPTLVQDVISIWHQNGTVTPKEVADYLASQQAFDVLVPKKP